jgi:hypothetical protein
VNDRSAPILRSHERDPDHRRHVPRDEPPVPESEPNPDRIRRERPALEPKEPVDPRCHPTRFANARSSARPG